jgi:succinoglycan biosynthesis protein ExoL
MLRAGGATVTLAGFARSPDLPPEVAALSPIILGNTHDRRFAQRLIAIAQASIRLRSKLQHITVPDVIIGRSLEMLALAALARNIYNAALVYECLDIHRLLLRNSIIGRSFRRVESALAMKAALLITSSPAFVSQYFQSFNQIPRPIILLENKVLTLEPEAAQLTQRQFRPPHEGSGEPWKIGWFGALRCRRSLELLSKFSRVMNGRVEIVLRGRPAYAELPNFDSFIEAEPYMSYLGPYRNPDDLAAIYGQVHFAWAVDFFEEGLNSQWLLPNRLYEGCFHGCLPIAVEGTETARFMEQLKIGFLLKDGSVSALENLISSIDAERFARASAQLSSISPSAWTHTQSDCEALANRISKAILIGDNIGHGSLAA